MFYGFDCSGFGSGSVDCGSIWQTICQYLGIGC